MKSSFCRIMAEGPDTAAVVTFTVVAVTSTGPDTVRIMGTDVEICGRIPRPLHHKNLKHPRERR